jgi:aminoglycoside phosphotransferase (APT) family kinase protein
MGILDTHRTLLSRLLPDDPPGDLAVRRGQFHEVVMGAERVVCFARTEAAGARLPRRAAVLRALARLELGFRTPEPLLYESGQPPYPPYLVLSRVPGAPLNERLQRHPAVAEQYAALLAVLATAGADPAVRAVLPHEPEDRWRRFAAAVRAELFGLMTDAGRQRAERELAALDGLRHPTHAVTHGDLGPENVLWDVADGRRPPRLVGVIDWDEAGLGDPAEDYAALAAGHGEELLSRVLALSGSPDMNARIAAIRGTFALQQAFSAHRDGDQEELADGLAGYR